jgi:hypothetical protein
VTLSGCNGVKQYCFPKSIKKILWATLGVLVLFMGAVGFYVHKMSNDVYALKQEKQSYIAQKQLLFSMKKEFEQKSIALEKKVEQTIVDLKLEDKRFEDEKKKRIIKNNKILKVANELRKNKVESKEKTPKRMKNVKKESSMRVERE